jgi:hypothetical protein
MLVCAAPLALGLCGLICLAEAHCGLDAGFIPTHAAVGPRHEWGTRLRTRAGVLTLAKCGGSSTTRFQRSARNDALVQGETSRHLERLFVGRVL